MTQSDSRSLSQIRRETEQTRVALTTTVEELRGTVSDTAADIKSRLQPDALKAEVAGYIKSRGEQLLNDITESARRNPMQAVAVGASVAYPALRIVRAVPLPILMIGAGLFLAGSKTGKELTQKASDMAAEAAGEAGQRLDEFRARAADLGDDAMKAVSNMRDRAGETLGRAQDALSGTMRQVSDQASSLAGQVSDQAGSIAGNASQMASRSADSAQTTASQMGGAMRDTQTRLAESGREAFDTARQRLSDAGEQLTEMGQKTADSVRDSIQKNPMLVAGLGLLVGGLIASVLPRSQLEGSLMGDASDTVKRRARQAAAAGFESAKDATGEILTNVAQQASAEGLTPDALAEGAGDIRERVQRVAERAVTTAFDPDTRAEDRNQEDKSHQSERIGGGRQNG